MKIKQIDPHLFYIDTHGIIIIKIQKKMKTLRFIGMVLFAVLMCVNFASCSSDDDPTEEKEEGGVVVSGKKLVKIIYKSTDDSYSETYTFSYDNKGRLVAATIMEAEEDNSSTDTFDFIWGDDVVKVTEKSTYSYSNSTYTESYILILKNGLVQYEDYGNDGTGTYTYNSSNRFVKFSDGGYGTETAIWDGDNLVATSDGDDDSKLTYGETCSKGYFPFIATIIDAGKCEALFMAHPEIAGMRTTQLPTSITWTYDGYYGTESETSTMEYKFNKEGYISKIIGKSTDSNGEYTLTWQ